MNPLLNQYDLIIVNSSGGKDSVCAIWQVVKLAKKQMFPLDRIVVSHQDLGKSEWPGVTDLVKKQCLFFGLRLVISKRRDYTGYEESFLEYAQRRGKWPSRGQRWCTSDFKTGPGGRVVTAETKHFKESQVLYVFGFRKEESPDREKKKVFSLNKKWTTQKRKVYDWLPIHNWSTSKVWATIHKNNLPYHKAYDLGMPRLSCVFCIFSPFNALVLAGKHNPELLDEYVRVEKQIGHTFKNGQSLEEVQLAVNSGEDVGEIQNWIM